MFIVQYTVSSYDPFMYYNEPCIKLNQLLTSRQSLALRRSGIIYNCLCFHGNKTYIEEEGQSFGASKCKMDISEAHVRNRKTRRQQVKPFVRNLSSLSERSWFLCYDLKVQSLKIDRANRNLKMDLVD